MSGSYGVLRTELNSLLALSYATQGSGGSKTLQQVLDAGNSSTTGISLVAAALQITDGVAVLSELGQGVLSLTDDLTYAVNINQDGFAGSNPSGASFFRTYNLEFNGGMGLFTDSLTSSMQLLNPIGNVDISGTTVSIMGAPYTPMYSRTDIIGAAFSSGRIIFPTPFTVIPSVTISQVTNGNILGLALTDITLIDFGWKSTAIGVGSIAWTAK